ncbi:hypothetical protein FPV67DRAFT_1677611 [Lyophyllum atratum]|nr:hypothetical protein FPV67DRAFT_1677611 [Lyophyllum atratum]
MSNGADIPTERFLQVHDTDPDALAVFYSHLRTLSLDDIKQFIWSGLIARLSSWPYFALAEALQLRQQYAWHHIGTQFAAPYAHLGLYMLQGLCSKSLVFSRYDTTKSVQNELGKFHTWLQDAYTDREPQQWLLDQAFFSILQTAYEKHLLYLHRHFGLSLDKDAGRVHIWNQAFDRYVDYMMLHICQWVTKRQEEESQRDDVFFILQDIPNKIRWYMLGQLHNHTPRLLAQQHTRIPMIEIRFIQSIADEMTTLEKPVIYVSYCFIILFFQKLNIAQVLSYFDPLISKASESLPDVPSLLHVMVRNHKVNHRKEGPVNSVAATLRLFSCIYATRGSTLRQLNGSLLSGLTIDTDNDQYKDIQRFLRILHSVYVVRDCGPSNRDWSSSHLDVDLFGITMDRTGRPWRKELASNANSPQLSVSIYAAIQLASNWAIEETKSPLLSKAINAIHNEGQFKIWFHRQGQEVTVT